MDILDLIFGSFMPHNHGAFMGLVVCHHYQDGLLFEQQIVIDTLPDGKVQTFQKRTQFLNN